MLLLLRLCDPARNASSTKGRLQVRQAACSAATDATKVYSLDRCTMKRNTLLHCFFPKTQGLQVGPKRATDGHGSFTHLLARWTHARWTSNILRAHDSLFQLASPQIHWRPHAGPIWAPTQPTAIIACDTHLVRKSLTLSAVGTLATLISDSRTHC